MHPWFRHHMLMNIDNDFTYNLHTVDIDLLVLTPHANRDQPAEPGKVGGLVLQTSALARRCSWFESTQVSLWISPCTLLGPSKLYRVYKLTSSTDVIEEGHRSPPNPLAQEWHDRGCQAQTPVPVVAPHGPGRDAHVGPPFCRPGGRGVGELAGGNVQVHHPERPGGHAVWNCPKKGISCQNCLVSWKGGGRTLRGMWTWEWLSFIRLESSTSGMQSISRFFQLLSKIIKTNR